MQGQSITDVTRGRPLLSGLILSLVSGLVFAQVPVDADGNDIAYSEQSAADSSLAPVSGDPAATETLEELVGRIALYPDDLLAVVLPASTYPLEIVQAARFLELLKTNEDLTPDEAWDESIVALLNYPEVVEMMNADIDWTWRLGDAVISQQAEVIAAVEAFRDRAYAAGNLKSDERQVVSTNDGAIEIAPVDEEIIYVPYYEPEEVVVYQPRPVYYYHPAPYPSYYYPYPAGHRFRSGYFWGVTTAFSIGWSNHYLNVYHPTYWGHPYYGHSYYSNYYRRPSLSIYNSWYVTNNRYRPANYHRDGDRWRPRSRAGSRPVEPRVRNEHYPPGRVETRGDHAAARARLNDRDNGRMNLGLRQRNDANRNRVANRSDSNRQTGLASSRRNAVRDTATRDARRNTQDTAGRTGARQTPPASGGSATTGTRLRSSVENGTNGRNRSRDDTSRRGIQFRERGNTSAGAITNSGSRRTPAADNGRVTSAASRTTRAAATNSGQRSNQQPANRQSANRASSTRTPTFRSAQPRAGAPRSTTAPSTRQRSSSGRSAATNRSASPRVSAPSRSAAPRVSAPARSSAPRASAPRSSAPRATSATRSAAPRAPAASRSSSSRGSSGAQGGSSRSNRSATRGSSRPRSSGGNR